MAQPARADHQQPDHQQHQAGRAVVAADLAAQRAANSSAQIEDLKIAAHQFQSAAGSELLVAKLDGKLTLDHPPQPRYRQPHPWGLSRRMELPVRALSKDAPEAPFLRSIIDNRQNFLRFEVNS